MDLFRCDRLKAELTAKGCVVNQARGLKEGKISLYGLCTDCETGRVIREASGLNIPDVQINSMGRLGMVDRKPPVPVQEKNMTESKFEAAETTPFKACKNHPDREALPNKGLCRECHRDYQNECNARKRAEKRATANGQPPAPKEEKPCSSCGQNPRHGKSSRCKSCLTKQISNPETKTKRLIACARRTKEAHAALRSLEAGEFFREEDRYQPVFALVPGLEEQIRARAEFNLRPLEAELAFLLREALTETLHEKA